MVQQRVAAGQLQRTEACACLVACMALWWNSMSVDGVCWYRACATGRLGAVSSLYMCRCWVAVLRAGATELSWAPGGLEAPGGGQDAGGGAQGEVERVLPGEEEAERAAREGGLAGR